MRQLLTGLHYCHVNQVLHRDIKGILKASSLIYRSKEQQIEHRVILVHST